MQAKKIIRQAFVIRITCRVKFVYIVLAHLYGVRNGELRGMLCNIAQMPAERINMNLEDRLIALETKITAQEDLLDVLNQTVYQQHKKIDELENLCITLARRLADTNYNDGSGALLANEKPPHY